MAAPLSMPSDPTPVSSVWRAISSLRFFRRLLGIPEERPDSGERCPRAGALWSWYRRLDGPDTSLTQAELEVLK